MTILPAHVKINRGSGSTRAPVRSELRPLRGLV
jgi:hypothetical protein